MPEVGYQEVYLARAFSRLGHQVRVFTSSRVSPSAKQVVDDYEPGLQTDHKYGYDVLRLEPFFTFRAKVIAKGLRVALEAFKPEVTVLVSLAKLFGSELVGPTGVGPAAFLLFSIEAHGSGSRGFTRIWRSLPALASFSIGRSQRHRCFGAR